MITSGLIVDFLGDSITEGYPLQDVANNRYDNVLKKLCGLKEVRNHGIGGTRIAYQQRPSEVASRDLDFCGRAHIMPSDTDMVIVFGGTNDYGHGDAPFGQISDRDRTTFCGSVRYLMEILVDRYPKAKLIFLTPARRMGDEAPSENPLRHTEGHPLKCYCNAIKEIAKEYPVDVFDTYEKLEFDPNIAAERRAYTTDGLHLNEAGHRLLAERLRDFLVEL